MLKAVTLFGLILEFVVIACAIHFNSYDNHREMMFWLYGLAPAIAVADAAAACKLIRDTRNTYGSIVAIFALAPIVFSLLLLLLWFGLPH